MRKHLAVIGSMMLCGTIVMAVPPPLSLDKAIQQADIVVVGTLGKVTEEVSAEKKLEKAVGTITVTHVLKGDKDTKEITLHTHIGAIPGPIGYKEGESGIWILRKIKDSTAYKGGNPTSLLSVEKLEEVKAEIEKQNK